MIADEAHIKREKAKARELRKSRWWQQKIANGAVCHYCHCSLTKEQATMDHVVPISSGGMSTRSNVVICCKNCNNKKKNQNPVDFLLNES